MWENLENKHSFLTLNFHTAKQSHSHVIFKDLRDDTFPEPKDSLHPFGLACKKMFSSLSGWSAPPWESMESSYRPVRKEKWCQEQWCREDREVEKGSGEDPNSLPRTRAPVTGFCHRQTDRTDRSFGQPAKNTQNTSIFSICYFK